MGTEDADQIITKRMNNYYNNCDLHYESKSDEAVIAPIRAT